MQIESEAEVGRPFRWVMLGLAFLVEVTQGLFWLSAVPLVLAVERDLRLNAGQVALWINLRLCGSFLLSIPSGLIADSWGVRRICGIGLLLLAAGGTLRGLGTSFVVLMAASSMYATGATISAVCLPKAYASWFPRREMGTASGIYLSGYGLGCCLALAVVRPAFGENWQECFLVTGVVGVVAALCWWIFAKERNLETPLRRIESPPRSIIASFAQASRSSVTWYLTAIFLLYAAAYTAWFTFGFTFLVRYRGIAQNDAGVILMLTMLGYVAAALTIPTLSDRIGLRRPFLCFFAALATCLFLSMIFVRSERTIEVVAFLLGTLFGTTNPLIFTIAAEAPELGPKIMGGAVGIITCVSSIAGFVLPTLTGRYLGKLASASQEKFEVVLALAASYAFGILVCGLLIRETGKRRSK